MLTFQSIGVLLILSQTSLQISFENSTNYIGAVVEFRPGTDGDGSLQSLSEIILINIHNSKQIISVAAEYGVDIIVFPEFGLTSLVKSAFFKLQNATEYRNYYYNVSSIIPSPDENIILCNANRIYAKSLQSISCLAQQYNMYVVVNHHEREDCPTRNCSPDGFLLYNTNVVFDRKGRLIARYRKFNLLHEPGTNVTREPEFSTFTTDFGVTFGQLVGFDLLREKPAQYFVKNPKVTDVVFSSRLFRQFPFTTSLEDQAAWAYAAEVNLLASSYNTNIKGSGGSGIYAGRRGPIRTYHTEDFGTALIIATIPKLNRFDHDETTSLDNSTIVTFNTTQLLDYSVERDDNVAPVDLFFENSWKLYPYMYKNVTLNFTTSFFRKTICLNSFCCSIDLKMNFDETLASTNGSLYYRYNIWVISTRNYEFSDSTASGELNLCALIACTDEQMRSCGTRYAEQDEVRLVRATTFLSVTIHSWSEHGAYGFYAPVAVAEDRWLTSCRDFDYVVVGPNNGSQMIAYTQRPFDDLMLFGIYGRRYGNDNKPLKSGGFKTIAKHLVVILIVIVGLEF